MSRPLPGAALARLTPLERGYYQRDTIAVATTLVGKLLIRHLPEGRAAVRITEAEAYLGVSDPAAHTWKGRRTARNATMWGEAGRLYVYFTYGMHHCANVVTREPEVAEAVLLRGGLAVHGEEIMAARRHGRGGRRLADGPAKLCQALGIDHALDGADLTEGEGVWLADDGFTVRPEWIISGPRVGVGYAGDATTWPLRFQADLGRSILRPPRIVPTH